MMNLKMDFIVNLMQKMSSNDKFDDESEDDDLYSSDE